MPIMDAFLSLKNRYESVAAISNSSHDARARLTAMKNGGTGQTGSPHFSING